MDTSAPDATGPLKLLPGKAKVDKRTRRRLLDAARAAAETAAPGPIAERSQDFLYDDDGLPG